MRVYGEILPWKKAEVKEIVSALDTGDSIFVDGETILPLHIRERETFHAGFTPTLETVVTPTLRQVSQSIVEAIERSKSRGDRRSERQRLEDRIAELEEALAEKQQAIEELEGVARTLGFIRVEVPGVSDEGNGNGPRPSGGEAWAPTATTYAVAERDGCRGLEVPMARGATAVIDVDGDDEPVLPAAVSRHVDRILARIAGGPLLHRRMLSFLVAHAPNTYSVDQIAAWIHCPVGLLENEPPREYLDMGLIAGERRAGRPHFRSTLKAFAVREFEIFEPDVGGPEMHHISSSLRDGLAALEWR
jgi:hypothetical protein